MASLEDKQVRRGDLGGSEVVLRWREKPGRKAGTAEPESGSPHM